MREIEIKDDIAGQKLTGFLHRYLPKAGTGFLYKMLRKKNILLNKKKATGNELLKTGDHVFIYFSEETILKFSDDTGSSKEENTEQNHNIEQFSSWLAYEDEQILIINKPAGVLSQKAKMTDVSVNEYMLQYLQSHSEDVQEQWRFYKPGVLNRLDRNTSGLMLAAKNLQAARTFSEAIAQKQIGKFYQTLVYGAVTEETYIRGWLSKEESKNIVTISESETEGASLIETKYRPLGVFYGKTGHPEGTFLEVELLTGKSHQIRAHLASVGHPLAGDVKYGRKEWNRSLQQQWHLQRQFLHAEKLVFPKDEIKFGKLSGKTIHAELPKDLQAMK